MGVQKSRVSSFKRKLKRKIILISDKKQNQILLKNIKKKKFLNIQKIIVYKCFIKIFNLDLSK